MAYSLETYYFLAPLAQQSNYLARAGDAPPADNQAVTLASARGTANQRWKVTLAGNGGLLLSALNDTYGLVGGNRFALNIWRGSVNYNSCDIMAVGRNARSDCVLNLETYDGANNVYRICMLSYRLYLTAHADGSVAFERAKANGASADQLWKLSVTQSAPTSRLGLPVQRYDYIYRGYSAGHLGIDYTVGGGTPILAAEDGTIIFARKYNQNNPNLPPSSWDTMGNCIYVQHPNFGMTLYLHLNAPPALAAGTMVARGQSIGAVGMTGNATGNHLHFGLKLGATFRYRNVNAYHDGIWADPALYL